MKNVLVLIDIQNEYTSPGRAFYLKGIEKSLENCRKLLKHARANKWDIVHIQHTNGEGAIRFASDSEFCDFVAGFEPLAGENHFVKRDYSCYSSDEFSSYMDELFKVSQENNVFLIGYNTVMCCLSTTEEARRRKHKVNLIEDATYAKAVGGLNEAETHNFMISLYKEKNLATIVRSQSVT